MGIGVIFLAALLLPVAEGHMAMTIFLNPSLRRGFALFKRSDAAKYPVNRQVASNFA